MFNQIRKQIFLNLVFAGWWFYAKSQTVQYFSPFELPVSPNLSIQLVGKVENNYLIYYTIPGSFPELIILNEKGQVTDNRTLDFIRPGFASHVNLVALPERLNIIFQETLENKHYMVTASVNKDGQLIDHPRYIDSTQLDLYGTAAFFDLINSADKKISLLYRVIRGFSNSQILFSGIFLGEKNELLGVSSFYIPFNTELETTSTPLLTNQGIVYFPVYDKATNYHIGTTLRIYQSAFTNKSPIVNELYLKENKPGELLLDWYEAKNQLVMGSLYYNFYSMNIEGLMTAFMTPGNNQADTIIYIPFEKDFKKSLKSHIYGLSAHEIINSLQPRYFKVNDSGSVILLTDIFTNSSQTNSTFASVESINRGNSYPSKNTNPLRNQTSSQYSRIPSADISLARNATNTPTNRSSFSDRASGSNQDRNRTTPVTNSQSQNFINSESNKLNSPYDAVTSTQEVEDALLKNKSLDYKSVAFSIDGSLGSKWMNWTRSLYVPGTSFSNIIIMPVPNGIGILNYEVNNRNVPYLYSQVLVNEGTILRKEVSKAGNPMLFYKKNALLQGKNSLLTLYSDEKEHKVGLAILRW